MAEDEKKESHSTGDSAEGKKAQRRKIPGNLPYTTSPGVFQRALEKIIISEKPSIFSQDFLSTVIGFSGGASRPIIPILKASSFLNQSAVPTEIYSQFQTEGGRATAALQALKAGFSEIFKRNQFAHKADDKAIVDLIVAITGLPRADPIINNILKTFKVFQNYTAGISEPVDTTPNEKPADFKAEDSIPPDGLHERTKKIGLVYNINIVLPETTNIDVYNAIFRSIKGNMM